MVKTYGIRDISPENYFLLNNGAVVKDLHELVSHLKKVDDPTFSHHVNESRNDFSNWIGEIIKEEKLAKRIQDIRDKQRLIKEIERRLASYKVKTPIKKPVKKEEEKININEDMKRMERELKMMEALANKPNQSFNQLPPTQLNAYELNDLAYINNELWNAGKSLLNGNIDRAKATYKNLLSFYNTLSDENKRKTHGLLNELYHEIINQSKTNR